VGPVQRGGKNLEASSGGEKKKREIGCYGEGGIFQARGGKKKCSKKGGGSQNLILRRSMFERETKLGIGGVPNQDGGGGGTQEKKKKGVWGVCRKDKGVWGEGGGQDDLAWRGTWIAGETKRKGRTTFTKRGGTLKKKCAQKRAYMILSPSARRERGGGQMTE